MTFALEQALSDREQKLLKAAQKAAYGEWIDRPEPVNATVPEQFYIDAIEAFRNRRPTLGYDLIERGNHRALLRLGRENRRQRRRYG